MTTPVENQERPLSQDVLYALRYYLGNRRVLLIVGSVVLVAGLAFNWSWLAAIGVAPLLLSVLPCVAMCALGLCMNKMSGRSCSTESPSKSVADTSLDTSTRAVSAETPQLRPTSPGGGAETETAATNVKP